MTAHPALDDRDNELRQRILATLENNTAVNIEMALFDRAIDELVELFHEYRSEGQVRQGLPDKVEEPLFMRYTTDVEREVISYLIKLLKKQNEIIDYLKRNNL